MSTTPDNVVDMHTHVFNARYVPLREIMHSRGVPNFIAAPLAKLIKAAAGRSKLPKFKNFTIESKGHHQETDNIEYLITMIAETVQDQATMILNNIPQSLASNEQLSLMKSDTTETVADQEIYEALIDIHLRFGDDQSAKELGLVEMSDGVPSLLKTQATFSTQDILSFFGIRRMMKKLLRKAITFVESAVDFLDFAVTMLRGEIPLLERLQNYYSDRGVQNLLLVHYMMDMEHPYAERPKYDFYADQIPRMMRLEQFGQGSLLGFAAFDPLRFLNIGANSEMIIAYLDMALSAGKLGFKFYPPMGFKPAGNAPELEKVVDAFFDYCADRAVPVFTHCTPTGFERIPKVSGVNADPKHWRKALEKPGRQNLILCFGHAGGGLNKRVNSYGWLSENEAQWNLTTNYAKEVVDLCRAYPNVYCEIANIDDIIDDSTRWGLFKNRLVTEYSRSTEHPYNLSDKIMYGTDWHMPDMVNDIIKYFDSLTAMFSDPLLSEYRHKFFAGNAVRYLNLGNFSQRVRQQLGDKCADTYQDFYTKVLAAEDTS